MSQDIYEFSYVLTFDELSSELVRQLADTRGVSVDLVVTELAYKRVGEEVRKLGVSTGQD